MTFDRQKLLIGLFCLLTTPLFADSFRIAFGSCYDQRQPSEMIFHAIAKADPKFMIMTGDNLYIDSDNPEKFASDYALLGANKGYANLAAKDKIMAIWDDHDYGLNDGGKDFQAKQIAKQYFVDFFAYEELQNIPEEKGIEHVRRVQVGEKVIQIIMLDTRWYRDDLAFNSLSEEVREEFQLGAYRPHIDPTKTLLGETQWQWLESQLKKPADLNVIVSSIQLVAELTAWETWANFPHERNRILAMLEQYSPGKAVILSGDVHRSETSRLPMNDWYLYEFTGSGLSATMYPAKPNIHRIGDVVTDNNFGLLDIEFTKQGIVFKAGYYDTQGKVLSEMLLTPTTGSQP
ncbi:MAG: alkaline phosphatase family protein [Gammaproteobacteria bacterium]|nr:alkaline phosphatase family protein [Gammaproteobacteria bacterium]